MRWLGSLLAAALFLVALFAPSTVAAGLHTDVRLSDACATDGHAIFTVVWTRDAHPKRIAVQAGPVLPYDAPWSEYLPMTEIAKGGRPSSSVVIDVPLTWFEANGFELARVHLYGAVRVHGAGTVWWTNPPVDVTNLPACST